MPNNRSLSKPSEPAEEEAVDLNRSRASKPNQKPKSNRQGRRINRLFTELDNEILEPDATQKLYSNDQTVQDTSLADKETRTNRDHPSTENDGRLATKIDTAPDGETKFSTEISTEDAPGLEENIHVQHGINSTEDTPEIPNPSSVETHILQPRPFNTRWSKRLGIQSFQDLDQNTTKTDQIQSTDQGLTTSGWESLSRGELIIRENEDQYSTLAYALPFGDRATDPQINEDVKQLSLLLEIVDEDPTRHWSRDELQLVEQVTDQLSLALENARLFEQATTRSEYLATLNEMSQALATKLKIEEVIETVYFYSTKLVEADCFYIALFDENSQEIYFPIVVENQERVSWSTFSINLELPGYIFRTRKPLLIQENGREWITNELQTKLIGREPESYLGVPMISGNQAIGIIAVQSFDLSRSFDVNDRDLLNSVASQAAVALLNAQLFEQTQTALSALEVSERYQKSVAQAVAVLTERGIAALSYVLEILGEATQANRTYYFETQVDGRGPYWRLISEWHSPGVTSQLGNPSLRRVSPQEITPWMENLRKDGYIASTTDRLLHEQKIFFESLGTRSVLQFAVAGRHEIPGCIGFEQADSDRLWGEDEISALQTAASALANTIAREDLFTQVQLNLAETEALYQASARLNSAATYEDILRVLRQHTILGHVNVSSITMNVFDKAWEYDHHDALGRPPEWLIPLAHWSYDVDDPLDAERIPITSRPGIEEIFQPEHPTRIMDLENDSRIDTGWRELFIQQMDGKSLLTVPLNVAGQWIGHIIAVYRLTTGFPEQEIRRLTSLAGQAAIAISGLRSLEETHQRNEELAVLNQITTAASESLELSEVLDQILDRVMSTTNYTRGLVSVLNPLTQKLTLAVHRNLPEKLVQKLSNQGLDGTPCDLVFRLQRSIYVPDLNNIPESSPDMLPWQEVFDGPVSLGFNAYIGVPLVSKGKVLGTVCIFNDDTILVDTSRITLLEAVGQQLGVIVENAELFQETEKALSETEMLYQAAAELSAVESIDDILAILRKYTVLGQADILSNIALFHQPQKESDIQETAIPIAMWTNLQNENIDVYYNAIAKNAFDYLSSHEPTIFEDLSNDPRLEDQTRDQFIHLTQTGSTIFIPLTVGGDWIGYVNGVFRDSHQFSDTEVRRFISLASQASVAVQNLRLFEETRRRANQLQTAAEIARDTSSSLSLETLLERAVNLIRDRFNYYHASIFLLDKSKKVAVVRESTGEAGIEMKLKKHSLPVGGPSVIGQVTGSGKPLVLNDISQEQSRVSYFANPLLPDTRAELGIPLKTGNQVIGALDVQSTRTDAFTQDDIVVLQTLADQIAVALDNARAYELARQAMEEIREADRLKSQFLANMSHELRTPLNSIIGFSRVILKGIDGPINDLQQQDLSAIYNSGQHLLGLINDVLDLSKIEAGKMELTFDDDVNLSDIIKSVMSTTAGLVKDKPIELFQEFDPDIPLLRIDPLKVRQVLLNLLSNAAKFTEEGSIKVTSTMLRGPDHNKEVVVSVIDTGPGIAPEDQIKLFQPFSQVDGSLTRKTGGSGLGLSICQHLIHMHGGRIGLTSIVGEGSTFYFTLPVKGIQEPLSLDLMNKPELPDTAGLKWPDDHKGQLQDHQKIAKKPEKPGPGQAMDSIEVDNAYSADWDKEIAQHDDTLLEVTNNDEGLILAIETDHQVIEFYRRYLSSHGYSIIAVTELEKAVTVAQGIRPIAITLDVSMKSSNPNGDQDMDGWKVLNTLKTNPTTQNIPVLICSLVDERDKALKLGADGYLVKPILADDLTSAINRLQKDQSMDLSVGFD